MTPETERKISKLMKAFSSEESLRFSVEPEPSTENKFQLSIVSRDFLGSFSIIASLLSSSGFNIIRGFVQTARREDPVAVVSLEVESKLPPDWQKFKSDLVFFFKLAGEGKLEEVRRKLHIRMVDYFRAHAESYLERLYPIRLQIDQDASAFETLVKLEAQDAFAFLYELTSALSSLAINIVRMEIETRGGLVSDELWLTTQTGEKILSKQKLKELRWAILLVKQFTHLLPKVPDPVVALDQMALFGREVFAREDFEKILTLLAKGEAIGSLSHIFGTSRYLWEEFIRTEHESIIPLLESKTFLKSRKSQPTMKRELVKKLGAAADFQAKVEALNAFKDQEMFRIDLRHLLRRTSYLEEFAEEFTDLCEVTVEAGYHLARDKTLEKLSAPMVSPDAKSEVSVLGLGKFGGRELGYASDLELMFVYTDAQDTSGEESQKNLHFYTELVRKFREIIWARHDGVFEIDLRLRPHGNTGPLAVSLELFRKYYSANGEAWSYERQSLVKLRAVGGSPRLGKEIERWRDEYVYGRQPFNFEEALNLRQRQKTELVKPGEENVKYASGGLLDIEYIVQTLQIVFGSRFSNVRRANTLQALRFLWQAGAMPEEEFQALRASYIFIRDLINALRIFRGNAKDLTVPKKDQHEFVVLARRLRYEGTNEEIRQKFSQALDHYMEVASAFYQKWMSRFIKTSWQEIIRIEVHPPARLERVSVDGILKEELDEVSLKRFETLGFLDVSSAVQNFKRIYPGSIAFEPFAKTFDMAWPLWKSVPDPNLALKHLEQLSDQLQDKVSFWELLSRSSKSLSALLILLGSSAYLSETLIAHPDYLSWLVDEKNWTLIPPRPSFPRKRESENADPRLKISGMTRLEDLRKLRHRETLRIALLEFLNLAEPYAVYKSFSDLADFVLHYIFQDMSNCDSVAGIGLGKLGGEELNFSSDIDLMFVSEREDAALLKEIEKRIQWITQPGPEGFLYRVDLRLRPHGTGGSTVISMENAEHYYKKDAEAWEYQMLIKARSVCGSEKLGSQFIKTVEPLIYEKDWKKGNLLEQIREVKRRYEAQTRSRGEEMSHVKMGLGGIRDIEFAVQIIQLQQGIRERNTLRALDAITNSGKQSESDIQTLREGYIFLRKIENRLQLFDNRQVFMIPKDKTSLRRLARSLGFSDLASSSAEDLFQAQLSKTMQTCRLIFERVFF